MIPSCYSTQDSVALRLRNRFLTFAIALALPLLCVNDGLASTQEPAPAQTDPAQTDPAQTEAVQADSVQTTSRLQQESEATELLKQLASPIYDERSSTAERILRQGFAAVAPVAHLLTSDDPEKAWRARKLLLQFFEQDLSNEQLRRIEMIIDLATASGQVDLIESATAAKTKVSNQRVVNAIKNLRNQPGVQINEYPVFQGRIFINQNGQIIPERQATPEIAMATEPTTLEGARFAKDHFSELVKKITSVSLPALSEIEQKLRDSGIQLALVDGAYQRVDLRLSIALTSEIEDGVLPKIRELCQAVPGYDISLNEIELTETKIEWVKSMLASPPLMQMTLNQCKLNSRQLSELDEQAAPEILQVVGRAMLGIRGNNLLDPETLGAGVNEVTVGSGAEAAGILPRDRIIEIDTVSVRNFEHLRRLIACYAPGDKVEMKVNRPGTEKPLTFSVELKPYAF